MDMTAIFDKNQPPVCITIELIFADPYIGPTPATGGPLPSSTKFALTSIATIRSRRQPRALATSFCQRRRR